MCHRPKLCRPAAGCESAGRRAGRDVLPPAVRDGPLGCCRSERCSRLSAEACLGHVLNIAFRLVCLALPTLPGPPCRVMYDTGEVEELDLNEVIRDGHMSLLA